MPLTCVWHVWPCQGWPADEKQERAFVAELHPAEPGEDPAPFRRATATAVLNALRTGATATTVLSRLPGLTASELLGAYSELERLRGNAAQAWQDLVEDPTEQSLEDNAAQAEALLPRPTRRLASAIRGSATPAEVTTLAAALTRQVTAAATKAAEVEHLLSTLRPGDARGVALGLQLHRPSRPTLYDAEAFLPARVGQLSPHRVADLFGERRAQEAA